MELSPTSAALARDRGMGEVLTCSVLEMPFPDDSFDLAVSLDVIEHLDDDLAALRELRRVVAPGGALLVTVPAAVSIVLNLLLGPPPRRLLEQALAHRLALAASLMRTGDDRVREAFQEALSEGVTELQTWLKMAGIEKSSPQADIASLGQATDSITTILLLVDFADRTLPETLPSPLQATLVIGVYSALFFSYAYRSLVRRDIAGAG